MRQRTCPDSPSVMETRSRDNACANHMRRVGPRLTHMGHDPRDNPTSAERALGPRSHARAERTQARDPLSRALARSHEQRSSLCTHTHTHSRGARPGAPSDAVPLPAQPRQGSDGRQTQARAEILEACETSMTMCVCLCGHVESRGHAMTRYHSPSGSLGAGRKVEPPVAVRGPSL